MKRMSIVLLLACVAVPQAQQPPPEIAFDSVANFLKLPPDMNLGEASGVAINSKGHVFVFTRAGVSGPAFGAAAVQLLEFGADGRFLREIGKGLYAFSFAHDVRIDKDDNIWCVDKGSNMVVKFNPDGHVVLVLGRKQESTDESSRPQPGAMPFAPHVDGYFRQPTDVAWDAGGNIFVSDGYVNARIAKYDKDGNWIKSWGEHGTGPGQFNTPHGIAVDARGNVYVADRNNRRIQVFDGNGTFLRQFALDAPVPASARPVIGNMPDSAALPQFMARAPWAICLTPGPNQVLYAADAFPGRVYKMDLEGHVLGVFGSAGKALKQFGWIHEMACPSENELYVAEVLNWRVQKLVLHPR
jgi:DNA-binding beta-propeller fold protein YncE